MYILFTVRKDGRSQALVDGHKLYFPSGGEKLYEGVAEVKAISDKGTYGFVYGRMATEDEFLPIEEAIADRVIDPEGLAEIKYRGVRMIFDERNSILMGYSAKDRVLEDIIRLKPNSPAYIGLRVKGVIRKIIGSPESSYRLPKQEVVDEYYQWLNEELDKNCKDENENVADDQENNTEELDSIDDAVTGDLSEEESDSPEGSEDEGCGNPIENDNENATVYTTESDNDGVVTDDTELLDKIKEKGLENISEVRICNNRLVRVTYDNGEKYKFFLMGEDKSLTEIE